MRANPKPEEREEGLRLAIEQTGSASALAREMGVSVTAVLRWWRVPAGRILQVEQITGIPRERLRPDLYRRVDATS